MANLITSYGPALAEITPEERERLLRYCARVTGDVHAAEDLVQETLLEAWLHAARIHTPDLRGPWLFGVARNICLRWLRSQGRETARQIPLAGIEDQGDAPAAPALVDAGDPLAEIERSDLAALLGEALALLPPATRAVLVGRYLEDQSQAALAAHLGVSEGAVEARLQRGKLALRRLLTTTFRDQLAAYGMEPPADDDWAPTRIWCPTCGQHRLVARFPGPPASVVFRCPGCDPDPAAPRSEFRLANTHFERLIGSLSRPRAVLNRVAGWVYDYFTQGVAAGGVACTNCGHPLPLHVAPPLAGGKGQTGYRLLAVCPACGEAVSVSFNGLVEALPPVQRFWHAQERMRRLPPYEVDAAGQPALVIRFESVTTAAGLTVVIARDPFRLLRVEGDPATEEDR
jgi:RNA polymerase sigma-70 factor (ECF subfamily)